MARKQSIYRQLALAEALASGMPESEIVRTFAQEWRLTRDAVRKAIKTLIATWLYQQPHNYASLSPWPKTPQTIERMQMLRAALATREARGEVIKRFAKLWSVTPSHVDDLIKHALAADQHNVIDECQTERLRYADKIRTLIQRYADARDFAPTVKAFDRLRLVSES